MTGVVASLMSALVPLIVFILIKKVSKHLGLGKLGMGFVSAAAIKASRDRSANNSSTPLGAVTSKLVDPRANTAVGRSLSKKGRALKAQTAAVGKIALDRAGEVMKRDLWPSASLLGPLASGTNSTVANAATTAALLNSPGGAALLAQASAGSLSALSSGAALNKLSANSIENQEALFDAARLNKTAENLDPIGRLAYFENGLDPAFSAARLALTGTASATPLTPQLQLDQLDTAKDFFGEIDTDRIALNNLGLPPLPIVKAGEAFAAGITVEAAAHPIWHLKESEKIELAAVYNNQGSDAYTAAAYSLLNAKGGWDTSTGEFQDIFKVSNIDLSLPNIQDMVQNAISSNVRLDNIEFTNFLSDGLSKAAIGAGASYAAKITQEQNRVMAESKAQFENAFNDAQKSIEAVTSASGGGNLKLPELTLWDASADRVSKLAANLSNIDSSDFTNYREANRDLREEAGKSLDKLEAAVSSLLGIYDSNGVIQSKLSMVDDGDLHDNLRIADSITETIERSKAELLNRTREAAQRVNSNSPTEVMAAIAALKSALNSHSNAVLNESKSQSKKLKEALEAETRKVETEKSNVMRNASHIDTTSIKNLFKNK